MSDTHRKLAKITKAHLELQERGILNFWIHVNYEEGGGQGIGGIALDKWDENRKTRIGTAYGCEVIRRLLLALQVNDFSEMAGKTVWVIGKGEGLSFMPVGLQALNVDYARPPVIFSEILHEMR